MTIREKNGVLFDAGDTPALPVGEPQSETDAQQPFIIKAGQTIVIHARFTKAHGAEECVGIFRATKDFRPVEEYQIYQKDHPEAGHPTTWDMQQRNAYVEWQIHARQTMEDAVPVYLFLEPWPEQTPSEAE